jgi:hypothetical protein
VSEQYRDTNRLVRDTDSINTKPHLCRVDNTENIWRPKIYFIAYLSFHTHYKKI